MLTQTRPYISTSLWMHGSTKGFLLEPMELYPGQSITNQIVPKEVFRKRNAGSNSLAVFDTWVAGASIEDFTRILDECKKEKDRATALRLHAHIRDKGLELHPSLGNHLVSMLVEVGNMVDAHDVFTRLVCRNDRCWSSIINGYVRCGLPQQAFALYENMQDDDLIHLNSHICVALLKASAHLKDLERGRIIHAELERKGLLENNVFVGSILVDMYAKCGSVTKAREVFDRLLVQDVVTWNALITGYVNHGFSENALNCFEQMQFEGAFPNAVTFVCGLKACSGLGDIEKGLQIHAEVEKKGYLGRSHVIGSAMVDMYAKCGCLTEAGQVFRCLSVRDVVIWTVLIAGYTEHGLYGKALDCLKEMQSEGMSPDAFTFVCCLRACGSTGATDKGQEIHAEIKNKGLESDVYVGSALVDFYAKCGLLTKAQNLFEKLPSRDMVSWNALIAGYVEHGHGEEALKCFHQMRAEGVLPGVLACVYGLKACGSMKAADKGLEIHAEIARLGLLESDVSIGSALVDMYSKCGLLSKAQGVFEKLTDRDVVSWNALIAGYADHGHGEEALEQFEQMQCEDIPTDTVTFICILKVCGSMRAIIEGLRLHAETERKGLLERDLEVGNSLVCMYVEWGSLVRAQEVFDHLPVQDVASWNGLLAGHFEHGQFAEAMKHFDRMKFESVFPDSVTFVIILKVCGKLGDVDRGQEIHAEVDRMQLQGKNPLISSTLVNMYVKFGLLVKARQVFDMLPSQDVASWNVLMAGYAEHGHGEEVLSLYDRMHLKGVCPNVVTYVCSLKACSSIGAINKGQEIHAEISSKKLLGKDLVIGNTLVDMYAKCGMFAKAREIFNSLAVRDVVSWTALIAGYADLGHGEEALLCFERMHAEGVYPNAVTLICSLKACGSMGATDRGHELHVEIERKGLLEGNPIVSNALVNMYVKCGSLVLAQQVFDALPVRGVILWNVLISGYTETGEIEHAFHAFDTMLGEGTEPDPITFVIVLSACSRKGLFDKGWTYFDAMSNDFGLVPLHEHHSCMVDLLVRAGQLEKAMAAMMKMPVFPHLPMWHTVLNACKNWGNVEVGKHAFKHAMRLDEMDSAAHVLMSQIYASAGMPEDAKNVERMRVEKLRL